MIKVDVFDRSAETVVLSGTPVDLAVQAFEQVVGPLLRRIVKPMDDDERGDFLFSFLATVVGSIAATVGPRNTQEMLQMMLKGTDDLRSQAKGEH